VFQNLNTWYNGRCLTLNPIDIKVPIITPVSLYLKNPWKNQENKLTGKYVIFIHDEGLEFNLISQVTIMSTHIFYNSELNIQMTSLHLI
jgi:hypothetical protein